MAGIYVHIPFCKKLCSYCDFYKCVQTTRIPSYIQALHKELDERREYLLNEEVLTIYFGGGTPSLLTPLQIGDLLNHINRLYRVAGDCEITLEANPDDLSASYLRELHEGTSVNRLSIGVQSFNDDDLKLLNRRHNAGDAEACMLNARKAGFNNISMDLIYGLPGMNPASWRQQLEKAFALEIEHLSAYQLTIEEGTGLSRQLKQGMITLPEEEICAEQFFILHEMALAKGFNHYEISNLARDGFISRHNSGYWQQQNYLGAGPSAHSYNGKSRQWNIADVQQYIRALENHVEYAVREELSDVTRYNEYLMVSLRTSTGADLQVINENFGTLFVEQFTRDIQRFVDSGHVVNENGRYYMTPGGWFISDYVLTRLMMEEKQDSLLNIP
ncbi:MAG: radical SAM family heme chaperone HemW [Bacteroidales bacterium]|nr:radical SAM family heme chaperone HemW [Bacteroidales bacterium]